MRESNQAVWMPLHRHPSSGMLKRFFCASWRGDRHLVKKARWDEGKTWILHQFKVSRVRTALPEGGAACVRVLLRAAGGGLRLRPDQDRFDTRQDCLATHEHVAVS